MTNDIAYCQGLPARSQVHVANMETRFAQAVLNMQINTDVVRMVVQIFGQPEGSAMKELLSRFQYIHTRSAMRVNFYFMGYAYPSSTTNFSPEAFTVAIEELERLTVWRYSGGTDILVLNSRYNLASKVAKLDYSQVVAITLESAIQEKLVRDAGQFCENLIQFARIYTGSEPTWGFSNSQGKQRIGSALKQLVSRILPEPLRSEVNKSLFVRVQDVARPPPE